MQKSILSLLLFIMITTIYAQESDLKTTTYFLIRHAEKDRTDVKNSNPDLSEIGIQRAQKWNELFQFFDIQAIYATNFIRTLKTVAPFAASKNIEIAIYNPTNINFEQFKIETFGKKVLIVGHSNSIPKFVNMLLNQEKYPEIADDQFSYLYIITLKGNLITDLQLTID